MQTWLRLHRIFLICYAYVESSYTKSLTIVFKIQPACALHMK